MSKMTRVYFGVLQRPFGPETGQGYQSGRTDSMFPFPTPRTYEEGLPPETRIPGFKDRAVLVSCETGEDTVFSSTP